MLRQKEKESPELYAGLSNQRDHFDIELARDTSFRPTLMCSICGKVVELEISKVDEHGRAVHGQCYAAMSWLSGE
jgi:hypothetical protein